MNPSFPITVNLADLTRDCEVTFEAVGDAASVVTLVEAFETAVQAGMFSSRMPPGVMLNVLSADVSDTKVRRSWRLSGVQPGAFCILLNMLEMAHHVVAPLESVLLASPPDRGQRMSLTELLQTPFPTRADKLPFNLTAEMDLEGSREPVIRVEFQQEAGDSECAALDNLFAVWDRVVINGGYLRTMDDRDEEVDPEEAVSSRQTYLAGANVVEHLFYEFIGAAEAYDALVNMVAAVHYTLSPVASLEIG